MLQLKDLRRRGVGEKVTAWDGKILKEVEDLSNVRMKFTFFTCGCRASSWPSRESGDGFCRVDMTCLRPLCAGDLTDRSQISWSTTGSRRIPGPCMTTREQSRQSLPVRNGASFI